MALESEILRNQLVITGVPENDKASLSDIICKLGDELSIDIPISSIMEVTRMGKKRSNDSRAILLHLDKKLECKSIIKAKKKKKSKITANKLVNDADSNIIININYRVPAYLNQLKTKIFNLILIKNWYGLEEEQFIFV